MEDTLAEGFKAHRQLPYARWICFLILKACSHIPPQVVSELTSTTTEFPEYDMRQLMGSSTRSRTPTLSRRQRPEVPETIAEQDEAIRAIVEIELEQFEVQQEDVV